MDTPGVPEPGLRVAALPAGSLASAGPAVLAHAGVLDEISPCLYRVALHGASVAPVTGDDDPEADAAEALDGIGLPVLPSIVNLAGGRRSPEAVGAVLRDPSRTTRHVWAICDLVTRRDHAGVDVDYQDLDGADRAAFTGFVAQLADALHAQGRRLSVTVGEPLSPGHDYAAIGAAADEVRLTTFGYHGPGTVAGPPAPLDWVREVLAHATARIPAGKLLVGATASGHDWVGRSAVPVGHAQALAIAARHARGVTSLDPLSGDRWFRYTAPDGRRHEVWFEDVDGVADKRRAAAEVGVRGVFLRLDAAPDARVWERLRRPG